MIRIFLVMSIISIVSLIQPAEILNTKKKRNKHLNSVNLPFFHIQDDQCKKYLSKIKKQRRKEFNKEESERHITPLS